MSAPVSAVVALCVGVGCGEDVVHAQEIEVDATGVRHASYESIPDDNPRWELDASPTLVIGEHDSGATYQFNRIIEARLHRGGVLVGDGGSREVRLFDSAGRHVSSTTCVEHWTDRAAGHYASTCGHFCPYVGAMALAAEV